MNSDDIGFGLGQRVPHNKEADDTIKKKDMEGSLPTRDLDKVMLKIRR